MPPPVVECRHDRIDVGDRFSVGFQRTLRIPDDGRQYPLPPGLGAFPIHRVEDYADRIPTSWRVRGGFFIALYQREALWISFHGQSWKPNAVKVGIGRINALSGERWDAELHGDPQDYIVCPPQLWLDGINAGEGYVRQFVAMPLGAGYTVEGQVTGVEHEGGMQVVVFEARPGRFPDQPPPRDESAFTQHAAGGLSSPEMGIAAGGRMRQKIYPDPHGLDAWDPDSRASFTVHIVNSQQYAQVTGRTPPLTPISAQTYVERGFPWFDLYDEPEGDVAASGRLERVKSIADIDAAIGIHDPNDAAVDVPERLIRKIHPPDDNER